jgi:Na+-driven multidrug efflux pump
LHDAGTIALAETPLRIMATTISIDAAAMVLQSCLIGAGDSRRVMLVSLLMQWVVFLPGAATLVLALSRGLLEVWVLYAVYRLLQAAVFTSLWQRERWMSIKL